MRQSERDVLRVMGPVLGVQRTQSEASRLLGKSVRQVRRIQRRLEAEGDGGVLHRLRGCRSNHKREASFRERVLAVYKADYSDFGPTLAAEKLGEREWLVSSETLRRWLRDAGLWTRKRRRDKHRSRRPRRECIGEMLQADGSEHDWTEGRGGTRELLVPIDDATNRIEARFYPGERLVSYFDLLGRWIKGHGRPCAFYADRSTIGSVAGCSRCRPSRPRATAKRSTRITNAGPSDFRLFSSGHSGVKLPHNMYLTVVSYQTKLLRKGFFGVGGRGSGIRAGMEALQWVSGIDF